MATSLEDTAWCGSIHVYNRRFEGSTVADIGIVHSMFYSFRGNTSHNSKKLLSGTDNGQNASYMTLQDNRIIDPVDRVVIEHGLGPLVMLDNAVRSRSWTSGPVVRQGSWVGGASCIAIGNRFTLASPISVTGDNRRFTSLDNETVEAAQIDATPITLPAFPRKVSRPVLEVPAGSSGSVIQQQIDEAAAYAGQRPVVHLPAGDYRVSSTLVVPANLDLELIGDSHASAVTWSGPAGGTVFRLSGPSRAAIRDLAINGHGAECLVVEGADQPGGRVFGQHVMVNSNTAHNLWMEGLDYTRVTMHDLINYSHDTSVSTPFVRVTGGSRMAAGTGSSRLAIFNGMSGGDSRAAWVYDLENGGQAVVNDTWYEGWTPRVVYLRGSSGRISVSGSYMTPYASTTRLPSAEFDGFTGQALITGLAEEMPARIANETAATQVLFAGINGRSTWEFQRPGTGGSVGLVGSFQNSVAIADQGTTDGGFVLAMFAQLRQEKAVPLQPQPAGVTDVRLYRVALQVGSVGLHVQGGGSSPSAVAAGAAVATPELALQPTYPNPFNAQTVVPFAIPGPVADAPSPVRLEVYALNGQRVLTLLQERLSPGAYQRTWDGRGRDGRPLASGLYLLRLTLDNQRVCRPVVLAR
ncbi:MAG: T9SS type A sorting domain-containing protein [Candidatus Latescibacterota bacterium]